MVSNINFSRKEIIMANEVTAEPTKRITIESAQIAFRNFAGKEDKFNPAGSRNFCVLLDPDIAATLKRDGWNIRQLNPRDEGDVPQDYMSVAVKYDFRPPKIVLISQSGGPKVFLDSDTVHILDWADIENIDLMITPYQWEVNGKTGIKAYLKKMFVILEEDELEMKYAEPTPSAYDDEEAYGDN